MAETGRIPRKTADFASYINNTTLYLLDDSPGGGNKNWERLALLAAEKNSWVAFRDAFNPLYTLWTDKKLTRTTGVTENMRNVQDDYTEFAQPLLVRIEGGPDVTIDDLLAFNIKSGPLRDDPSTSKTPIEAVVYFGAKQLGGGDMRLRCTTSTDATRASIAPGAKGVEVCFKIDGDAPTSAADCELDVVSTKALFTYNFGASNAGKRIYLFARWIDTTDPNRSGPWSDMVTAVIT